MKTAISLSSLQKQKRDNREQYNEKGGKTQLKAHKATRAAERSGIPTIKTPYDELFTKTDRAIKDKIDSYKLDVRKINEKILKHPDVAIARLSKQLNAKLTEIVKRHKQVKVVF